METEHHSYTAQGVPDKLTDMTDVEVTGWVSERLFVVAVEHSKQLGRGASCTSYSFVNLLHHPP